MKIKIIAAIGIIGFIFLCSHFGLFSRYNFFTAKIDIYNEKPKIVSIGMPALSENVLNEISEKYGFYNLNYGCVVGAEFEGIESYNRTVENYLEERNGENWRKKYESELDSLVRIKRK